MPTQRHIVIYPIIKGDELLTHIFKGSRNFSGIPKKEDILGLFGYDSMIVIGTFIEATFFPVAPYQPTYEQLGKFMLQFNVETSESGASLVVIQPMGNGIDIAVTPIFLGRYDAPHYKVDETVICKFFNPEKAPEEQKRAYTKVLLERKIIRVATKEELVDEAFFNLFGGQE